MRRALWLVPAAASATAAAASATDPPPAHAWGGRLSAGAGCRPVFRVSAPGAAGAATVVVRVHNGGPEEDDTAAASNATTRYTQWRRRRARPHLYCVATALDGRDGAPLRCVGARLPEQNTRPHL